MRNPLVTKVHLKNFPLSYCKLIVAHLHKAEGLEDFNIYIGLPKNAQRASYRGNVHNIYRTILIHLLKKLGRHHSAGKSYCSSSDARSPPGRPRSGRSGGRRAADVRAVRQLTNQLRERSAVRLIAPGSCLCWGVLDARVDCICWLSIVEWLVGILSGDQ